MIIDEKRTDLTMFPEDEKTGFEQIFPKMDAPPMSLIRVETYEGSSGSPGTDGALKEIIEDVHSKGCHLVEWTDDGMRII
jgi:hypothetical protein